MRCRHAVHHDLLGATGGRNYSTSGAHTEAIYAAPVDLGDKAILGSRKILSATVLIVVLYLVDEFRGMLQTHAHSNALGFDVNTRGIEVTIYVTCRVARGEDDGAAESAPGVGFDTYHLVLLHDETIHACLEVYFTATTAYGFAHVLNDAGQFVGTDVRVRVAQDGCRCSVLAEYVENLLHVAALLATCV